MLMLVFLKIASDLAVYYTFAAFFGCFFGLNGVIFLPVLLIQSGALALSWLARGKGRRRMVPAALGLLSLLIPGLGAAGAVIALPTAIYVLYLAARSVYEPEWGVQRDIFTLFWKLALGFAVLAMMFGRADWVADATLPFAMVALTFSVMLTRSLRHDPEVYRQVRYQAVDILLVCAVLLLALFSNVILTGAAYVANLLFEVVIRPLLTLLYGLAGLIGKGIGAVIGLIRRLPRRLRDDPEGEPSATPAPEGGPPRGEPVMPTQSEVSGLWAIPLLVLAAAIVIVVLVVVFRLLSRREGTRQDVESAREIRETAPPERQRRAEAPSESAAVKVRAQYRRFLKLDPVRARWNGKSETSGEIEEACRGRLDDEAAAELRALYIKARYDGVATSGDARRARELYHTLRRAARGKF